jgi:hypothetical protein
MTLYHMCGGHMCIALTPITSNLTITQCQKCTICCFSYLSFSLQVPIALHFDCISFLLHFSLCNFLNCSHCTFFLIFPIIISFLQNFLMHSIHICCQVMLSLNCSDHVQDGCLGSIVAKVVEYGH